MFKKILFILGLVVGSALMASEQVTQTESVQIEQVASAELNTVIIDEIQIKTYLNPCPALTDFDGSRIAVVKDSTAHQDLMRKASKHVTLIAVSNPDEAKSLLGSNRVDAFAY